MLLDLTLNAWGCQTLCLLPVRLSLFCEQRLCMFGREIPDSHSCPVYLSWICQQQQQLAYAGLNGRGSLYPGQALMAGLNVGLPGVPLEVPASLQLRPALQAPVAVVPPALLGKGYVSQGGDM